MFKLKDKEDNHNFMHKMFDYLDLYHIVGLVIHRLKYKAKDKKHCQKNSQQAIMKITLLNSCYHFSKCHTFI